MKALALRAQNLGTDSWSIWGRLDPTSVLKRLDDDDWRALVVDLGSLPTADERDAVAAAVLGHLWGARARRRPVLVVIDEAHNVAPDATDDPRSRRTSGGEFRSSVRVAEARNWRVWRQQGRARR